MYLVSMVSRPALGSNQPRIQPATMKNGQGVKLTTHFHLVLRSGIVKLYLHSPILLMAWCVINRTDILFSIFIFVYVNFHCDTTYFINLYVYFADHSGCAFQAMKCFCHLGSCVRIPVEAWMFVSGFIPLVLSCV
jgi:hypothetical protein